MTYFFSLEQGSLVSINMFGDMLDVLLGLFWPLKQRELVICRLLEDLDLGSSHAEALGLTLTWHITSPGAVVVLEFHNPTFEKAEQGGLLYFLGGEAVKRALDKARCVHFLPFTSGMWDAHGRSQVSRLCLSAHTHTHARTYEGGRFLPTALPRKDEGKYATINSTPRDG